jgi:hypothetical protein
MAVRATTFNTYKSLFFWGVVGCLPELTKMENVFCSAFRYQLTMTLFDTVEKAQQHAAVSSIAVM